MHGDRLADLTWTDLRDRSAVVVVPVGSVEQHGPHLPLDTDTRIAIELAERAVLVRDQLVLAPAVAIGASGEHAGFAGTLSIGTEVLTEVLVEIGRSADRYAGVVFVNGHGGNLAALTAAATRLLDEGRPVLAWSPSISDGDAHGGRTETSMLLAIDPGCVRIDAAQPGALAPVATLLDELREGGVIAVSPNGVLGDPRGATIDEGHELLRSLTDQLLAAIDRAFPTP